MVSPGEMKTHLAELEEEKSTFQEEIRKAKQRFNWSLGGIAAGVLLLPFLLFAGIPVLVVAGAAAVYFTAKKTNYEDKLEAVEAEIHKMEISMA